MDKQKYEPSEIDLLQLFKSILIGIKKIIASFLRSILFLVIFGIKKSHFIALFALLGIGIGFFKFHTTPKMYSSSLIAKPNGISAKEMVEYINVLSEFCKNNNHASLAYSLGISEKSASRIQNIQSFNYIDVNGDKIGDFLDINYKFDASDTTKKIDENKLLVSVKVTNNESFTDIREGIFTYIESNPYFSKLNNLRRNELNELAIQIKLEIDKLDSLQNVVYFNSPSSYNSLSKGGLMFISENTKQMFYKNKLELIKQKQEYEKELELSSTPITILKDFSHLVMQENTKGGYIMKYGFVIGLLSYIVLLILYKRERIKKFLEN